MDFTKEGIIDTYYFLTNKRCQTYSEILAHIKILTNQVNPNSIMIDFEHAKICAVIQEYSLLPRNGFLFYFSKNVYRKIQELGLVQLYLTNIQICLNVKMIPVSYLSVLPRVENIQAFETLVNQSV